MDELIAFYLIGEWNRFEKIASSGRRSGGSRMLSYSAYSTTNESASPSPVKRFNSKLGFSFSSAKKNLGNMIF